MTDVESRDDGSPALLRHIRDELTVQLQHSLQSVSDGGEPDHCEKWVKSVQDQMEWLSRSKDSLNDDLNELDVMTDVKASWQSHLDWVDARLEQYPGDASYEAEKKKAVAALKEMDREIRKQEDEVQSSREAVALDKAALRRDLAALKRCRDDHPYEHHCGERGGPGVRRPGPEGKCMGWDEINDQTK